MEIFWDMLFIHLHNIHNGISTISLKGSNQYLSTTTHTFVVIYSLSWMHCTHWQHAAVNRIYGLPLDRVFCSDGDHV